MRTGKLAFALIFGSSTVLAGLALAQVASPVAQSKPAIKLADDTSPETYIQHLRNARKLINDAKDAFEKDPVDPADHRKEAIEGIDKALKAIDSEIVEYKGDGKK